MGWRDVDNSTEHERMPYIQITADLWVVMREAKDRPRAVIERVRWHDGSEQYLLKTWHSDPGQRRLVRIHDTLEDANRSVKWQPTDSRTPSRDGYPIEELRSGRSGQARRPAAVPPPTP